MKIEKNKVVEVSYELTVDGNLYDIATKENPLDYIHGTHMLIPKFEEAVEGLQPGDTFAFDVEPEEGYGEYDPKRVLKLPMTSFEINGELRRDLLEVGRQLPMYNRHGKVEYARIQKIEHDGVTMDFNHELAGKKLVFRGAVVSVREATEQELQLGLHGEFAPVEECGCHDPHEGGCCCHHGKGHHHHEGCCHDGDPHEGCCENH
ncbi:MAG: peptidylprolyl isomerase, partial [Bacteroidales bacterium]|nr:peptidylprolyl isomerase [Bacteroidales bacterium]